MEYDRWVLDVVQAVEAVGAGIMIVGGVVVFIRYLLDPERWRAESYRDLRKNLGQVLQLGLEVLIVADIVRTIVVTPTLTSVAVLGSIVLIRILLSWSLDLEIKGTFPWQRPRPPSD
jgi:uncharacterized membrane protein